MDSGQDLLVELRDKQIRMESALGALGKRGKARAEAEMTYRIALRKKMLEEREKSTPVTILSDICRGDKEIARLKFDRDVAETMYEAVIEAINVYKLEARQIESQIEREWNR